LEYHYYYCLVICCVTGIHSVPWQQVDAYPAGESRRECTHDNGHLLFSGVIQRHWNQVDTAVWSKVGHRLKSVVHCCQLPLIYSIFKPQIEAQCFEFFSKFLLSGTAVIDYGRKVKVKYHLLLHDKRIQWKQCT